MLSNNHGIDFKKVANDTFAQKVVKIADHNFGPWAHSTKKMTKHLI
jgi:hypothetical protein